MVEKENEEVVDEKAVDEKALELAKKISKGEVAVVVSPIHSDEETTRVLGTSAGYGIGASIDILGRALSGKKVRPDELSKVGEFGVNLIFGIGQALSASRRSKPKSEAAKKEPTNEELIKEIVELKERIKELEKDKE